MNVTITKENNKSIVKIEGRVDTITAKEFEQAIQPLMSEPNPDIVLECSEFTYISSSGLRVFLLLQKSVIARNGELVIKNLCSDIKEVFAITGFASIFNIK